jgi:pimeloyl-ACP methyl ester carboxylesterase
MSGIYRTDAGKRAIEERYRDALRRWPVANRQLVLPTRHGETFVVASGEENRMAVVLLHGSGTNSSVWMPHVADWARDFRVYAVDVIGEPGLSAPSRPAFRSDAYVEWLDDVWNGLGVESAAVVGVSLGGWLALEYAVKRPQRVAALSLVSPSGVGSQKRVFLLKAGALLLFGEWGRRRALGLVAGRRSLSREVTDALLLRYRYFRPRMDSMPIRTDEELAGLSMPVQVIVGGRDVMLRSNETRDRIQRHVANARVIYLENEGHIVGAQGSAVASFVREALARV